MKEEFVSRQQVNLLPEKLRKAEETDASKELNFYMWDLYRDKAFTPLNILIVGAGGSYPAALLAKHAIHDEMRTPNVEAVTPQTAVRILSQFDHIGNCNWKPKYDLVIGISYSGKSPDILKISDLCFTEGYPFILVTGAEKSKLSDNCYLKIDKIISYFNPSDNTGKERGIVSMFSTLAPAIIFDDNWTAKLIPENQEALRAGEKFVSDLDISNIAKTLKKCPIIHVFYEWDTLPTAIDIESKFTESGIANVVLHEKKNFSHGRFTSLYNQNFALVINLTRFVNNFYLGGEIVTLYRSNYDSYLTTFLTKMCEDKSAHYIGIEGVPLNTSQWNIEAMTKIPYLITAIGEELGIDISKPLKPFPEEAIQLYDYKGKF